MTPFNNHFTLLQVQASSPKKPRLEAKDAGDMFIELRKMQVKHTEKTVPLAKQGIQIQNLEKLLAEKSEELRTVQGAQKAQTKKHREEVKRLQEKIEELEKNELSLGLITV